MNLNILKLLENLPDATVIAAEQKELKMHEEKLRLENAEAETHNFIYSIPFQLKKADNAVHKFEYLRYNDELFIQMYDSLREKKYQVDCGNYPGSIFTVGPLSVSLELAK